MKNPAYAEPDSDFGRFYWAWKTAAEDRTVEMWVILGIANISVFHQETYSNAKKAAQILSSPLTKALE